jgi:hypothetical protein
VFTLYPNPTSGTATLRWQLPAGQRAARLLLYSSLGQWVREVALPAGTSGSAAVAGLAPGSYLARLLSPTGAALGHPSACW